MALPALLIPTLGGIVSALADEFISSDAARGLLNFAFDVAGEGNEAQARLETILAGVRQKKAEAEANGTVWTPTPEELQEIRDRINARDAEWAALPG